MNRNDDYALFIQNALSAMNNKDYYSLYNTLLSICTAEENEEMKLKLQNIKKEMPIDFMRFQEYFNKSHFSLPNRRIIFKDIGKVKYEEIPVLFEKYSIEPLSIIAVEILGGISKSQSSALKKFIQIRTEETGIEKFKLEPKVDYDA